MARRIIYSRPGGEVSIVTPMSEWIARLMAKGMTEDEAIASIQAKDVPSDAVDVVVIEDTAVPFDRWFRNAWRQVGGIVSIDVTTARGLQMAHILKAIGKEIARLHTDSIDFKQRLIKISGKGDPKHTVRERIIPVTEPIALSALETYLRLRPQSVFPHLFLSCRLEPLQHAGFRQTIQKISRQAQIHERVTITELRKSFSSLCAVKGIDPLVLKQIMGHNSIATTMKYYLTIREQQLKEVWEYSNPLRYFSRKEWKEWIF